MFYGLEMETASSSETPVTIHLRNGVISKTIRNFKSCCHYISNLSYSATRLRSSKLLRRFIQSFIAENYSMCFLRPKFNQLLIKMSNTNFSRQKNSLKKATAYSRVRWFRPSDVSETVAVSVTRVLNPNAVDSPVRLY